MQTSMCHWWCIAWLAAMAHMHVMQASFPQLSTTYGTHFLSTLSAACTCSTIDCSTVCPFFQSTQSSTAMRQARCPTGCASKVGTKQRVPPAASTRGQGSGCPSTFCAVYFGGSSAAGVTNSSMDRDAHDLEGKLCIRAGEGGEESAAEAVVGLQGSSGGGGGGSGAMQRWQVVVVVVVCSGGRRRNNG